MSNFLLLIWLSFLRFVLSFLHFGYSGYQYFYLAWNSVKRKLFKCLQLQFHDSEAFVSQFVSKLEKRPSHFATIVGDDGISFEDFSNIVIWCSAAKIPFVSFYDYTGYLKANQSSYFKYLIDKRKLDPNLLVTDIGKLQSKNGVSYKIHVNIVSIEDGKQLFVPLTRNLSSKVVSNQIQVKDVDEKLINEELHHLCGMPEPELAIICGTTLSTFGYLPWHIRVTEFLQVEDLNGIHVSEFTSILKKYSSCTQRFGK